MPFFQTNLFLIFTQVKLFSSLTEVAPALPHFAPALTAALEGATAKVVVTNMVASTSARPLRKLLIIKV